MVCCGLRKLSGLGLFLCWSLREVLFGVVGAEGHESRVTAKDPLCRKIASIGGKSPGEDEGTGGAQVEWKFDVSAANRNVTLAEEMFHFAFDAYVNRAFPADGIRPISGLPHLREKGSDEDYVFGNYSLALVDSMDALVAFGRHEDFRCAVDYLSTNLKFDTDVSVSLFEATIRVLGGLLSAHLHAAALPDLLPNYSGRLLALAENLGTRLLGAFRSATGLPYPRVNLRHGLTTADTVRHSTISAAEAGTLTLEFGMLSHLTGNPRYYEAARKATLALRLNSNAMFSLVPSGHHVALGAPTSTTSGVVPGVDSYIEYLMKADVLFGDEELGERFWQEYSKFDRFARVDGFYHQVDALYGLPVAGPGSSERRISVFSAFYPALQVLAGDLVGAVTTFNHLMALWSIHRALPEVTNLSSLSPDAHGTSSPIRPELLESTFYLHWATKDPAYGIHALEQLKAINETSRVGSGFATRSDVRTLDLEDKMESFVFAETFLYPYLILAGEETLAARIPYDLDLVVFTTEGHMYPLPSTLPDVLGVERWLDCALGPKHPARLRAEQIKQLAKERNTDPVIAEKEVATKLAKLKSWTMKEVLPTSTSQRMSHGSPATTAKHSPPHQQHPAAVGSSPKPAAAGTSPTKARRTKPDSCPLIGFVDYLNLADVAQTVLLPPTGPHSSESTSQNMRNAPGPVVLSLTIKARGRAVDGTPDSRGKSASSPPLWQHDDVWGKLALAGRATMSFAGVASPIGLPFPAMKGGDLLGSRWKEVWNLNELPSPSEEMQTGLGGKKGPAKASEGERQHAENDESDFGAEDDEAEREHFVVSILDEDGQLEEYPLDVPRRRIPTTRHNNPIDRHAGIGGGVFGRSGLSGQLHSASGGSGGNSTEPLGGWRGGGGVARLVFCSSGSRSFSSPSLSRERADGDGSGEEEEGKKQRRRGKRRSGSEDAEIERNEEILVEGDSVYGTAWCLRPAVHPDSTRRCLAVGPFDVKGDEHAEGFDVGEEGDRGTDLLLLSENRCECDCGSFEPMTKFVLGGIIDGFTDNDEENATLEFPLGTSLAGEDDLQEGRETMTTMCQAPTAEALTIFRKNESPSSWVLRTASSHFFSKLSDSSSCEINGSSNECGASAMEYRRETATTKITELEIAACTCRCPQVAAVPVNESGTPHDETDDENADDNRIEQADESSFRSHSSSPELCTMSGCIEGEVALDLSLRGPRVRTRLQDIASLWSRVAPSSASASECTVVSDHREPLHPCCDGCLQSNCREVWSLADWRIRMTRSASRADVATLTGEWEIPPYPQPSTTKSTATSGIDSGAHLEGQEKSRGLDKETNQDTSSEAPRLARRKRRKIGHRPTLEMASEIDIEDEGSHDHGHDESDSEVDAGGDDGSSPSANESHRNVEVDGSRGRFSRQQQPQEDRDLARRRMALIELEKCRSRTFCPLQNSLKAGGRRNWNAPQCSSEGPGIEARSFADGIKYRRSAGTLLKPWPIDSEGQPLWDSARLAKIAEEFEMIEADPSDACKPLNTRGRSNIYKHKAVLADRGGCTFHQKLHNILATGASVAIAINNANADAPLRMVGNDHHSNDVPIRALMVSKHDGEVLRSVLQFSESLEVSVMAYQPAAV